MAGRRGGHTGIGHAGCLGQALARGASTELIGRNRAKNPLTGKAARQGRGTMDWEQTERPTQTADSHAAEAPKAERAAAPGKATGPCSLSTEPEAD